MSQPLRLLFVETSDNDTAVILALLDKSGYQVDWQRVSTSETLRAALADDRWDLVLSDYQQPRRETLTAERLRAALEQRSWAQVIADSQRPQLAALDALAICHQLQPELPIVVVSATERQEVGLNLLLLKAGAADFLTSDSLSRLPSVIVRTQSQRAERRRAAAQLATTQRFASAIAEQFPGLLGYWTPDQRCTFANRAYLDWFGRRPDQVIGITLRELLGSELHRKNEPYFLAALNGTAQHFERILTKVNGEVRHTWTQYIPDSQSGVVIGVFVLVSDITEEIELPPPPVHTAGTQGSGASRLARELSQRRQLQEQLRLLEASVAHLTDLVVITDLVDVSEPGPRILFVNHAFERLTGYSRAEVIGRSPRFLQGPKTSRTELARIRNALIQRQPVRAELINYSKSGQEYCLELEVVPMADSNGQYTHAVAIERDITGRRDLEEKLRQAQKLEAVGQLAGGVAHDLNNVLTAMMLNLELLRDGQPEPESPLHELDLLTQRSAQLTHQLLTFAKRQPLRLRRIELHAALTLMLSRVRRLLGQQILIELDFHPGELWVEADVLILEQAVQNLCQNGRDAMPSGGKLVIGTQPVQLEAADLVGRPASRPGRFIALRVTDSGSGLSSAALEHLFEPFFTTKPPGQGSGLGLALVHSIAAQHRGWVSADSPAGQGASFVLFLPHQSSPPAIVPNPLAEKSPPPTAQQILLVEDEERVRKASAAMLRQLGHQVVVASDGIEALRLWAEQAASIDLLLTDMVMPGGLSGIELATQLRRDKPALRTILMSGYSAEIIQHDIPAETIDAFLAKPFSAASLAAALRPGSS